MSADGYYCGLCPGLGPHPTAAVAHVDAVGNLTYDPKRKPPPSHFTVYAAHRVRLGVLR